jgi:hypothetical protein
MARWIVRRGHRPSAAALSADHADALYLGIARRHERRSIVSAEGAGAEIGVEHVATLHRRLKARQASHAGRPS